MLFLSSDLFTNNTKHDLATTNGGSSDVISIQSDFQCKVCYNGCFHMLCAYEWLCLFCFFNPQIIDKSWLIHFAELNNTHWTFRKTEEMSKWLKSYILIIPSLQMPIQWIDRMWNSFQKCQFSLLFKCYNKIKMCRLYVMNMPQRKLMLTSRTCLCKS